VSILIRPAHAADLPVLGQLAGALVRYHHALDPRRYLLAEGVEAGYARWFRRELDNPDAVVLSATDADQIVGYAYGRLEERDWNALLDRHGALHDIFVDPSARRRGIARQLLGAMLRALENKGAPRVLLHTAVQNTQAQALFAAFGFRTTMLEMTRERQGNDDQ
jgi:ribosomal protein S18 acetylase RimI-like enzyme